MLVVLPPQPIPYRPLGHKAGDPPILPIPLYHGLRRVVPRPIAVASLVEPDPPPSPPILPVEEPAYPRVHADERAVGRVAQGNGEGRLSNAEAWYQCDPPVIHLPGFSRLPFNPTQPTPGRVVGHVLQPREPSRVHAAIRLCLLPTPCLHVGEPS